MSGFDPRRWWREARRTIAALPRMTLSRLPDAPALPVRDLWPGDATRGARLVGGELELAGTVRVLQPGNWGDQSGSTVIRAHAHGFSWLRDLRALGTDAARTRARALVTDWIASGGGDAIANRADVVGTRIVAWLGHYDFFAASADDEFRQRLMGRLVADTRALAAALPTEERDQRALVVLKGLIAAASALPDNAALITRGLRFLASALETQVLADGSYVERSPSIHLTALQDLTEIRALLQAAQTPLPAGLTEKVEQMAGALRCLRHGDGGLALFNGSKEEASNLVDLVLTQAGRGTRAPVSLPDGRFYRLAAGRSVMIVDGGPPPAPGFDRFAHAGTLSFELSVGRERLIVNCGAAPAAGEAWRDASRATAAHSTLVIADVNSSELKPQGLGRRPGKVEVQRQEANGAHWLEASHDGWQKLFGAIHRRRLYMAESGEDVRGEDVIEAATPQPFTLRFHLHPRVTASLQQDGEAVLLRLPSDSGWRLRAEGARIGLEESVYLGGPEPRRCEQVVLSGPAQGPQPQQVKWAITRIG